MPMKALPLPPKGWHGIKSNNAARQMAALGQKQKRCILRGVASSAHCLRCHSTIGDCLCVRVGGREIESSRGSLLALMSSQISFSLLRLRRATTENEFIMSDSIASRCK